MSQGLSLAIVGAAGLVGEAVLEILDGRGLELSELTLLDTGENVGKHLQFKETSHQVKALEDFDFSQAQLAVFVAGDAISEEYAQQAADQGCVVVDSSSAFANEFDVPVVVADVNPERVMDYQNRGILSVPGSAAAISLQALAPIHRHASIKRVNVTVFQAVSSLGKSGIEELAGQTARLLNGQTPESNVFDKQIAFNVLPQVGKTDENGYSYEELQLVNSIQAVLGEGVAVNPTCTQVPVFFGHGVSLAIECWDPVSAEEVKELFAYTDDITIAETSDGYATAVTDAAKSDQLYIDRIREDISCENGINLWLVADNVRRGIALNSVLIVETLINQYL